MPNERSFHVCGLIADPESGPQIVAAGGVIGPNLATVDIYTINTDLWRKGNNNQSNSQKVTSLRKLFSLKFSANPLPKPIDRAASFPYGDTFLIIGGFSSDDGYLADIYQYNAKDDSWIKREAELNIPRRDHVALAVKQSLFQECDKCN